MKFAFGDGSVRKAFQDFAAESLAAMKVGANNDELTRTSAAGPKLKTTLLNYLERAAAAGDRGESGQHVPWLDRYIGVPQKVRGLEVPAMQADPMILIGQVLKAGGGE